jgi:hypothetical protein
MQSIISMAFQQAQILTSAEAELMTTPPRWIFDAPTFRAGAGEYVVMHKQDWDRFIAALKAADSGTDMQQSRNKQTTNPDDSTT